MSETPQLPYHRLIISGRICVRRSLHIGSGQASLLTDAAIRRDRKGKPFIPGSTLAGLLRSVAEDFAPYLCQNAGKSIKRLFGSRSEDRAQSGDFQASSLIVEDAYICEPLSAEIEVRDHVGIDRRYAAARPHLKYDHEVAHGNASYGFEIYIESPNAKDERYIHAEDVRLLLAVLDFWSTRGLKIGARTTTGLGEATVDKDSLQFNALDFRKPKVLKSFLFKSEAEAKTAARIERGEIEDQVSGLEVFCARQSQLEFFTPQHLSVSVALILEEPMLVKGSIPEVPDESSDQRTSDAEFVTALEWEGGSLQPQFYIPGSSLKGVLRARAEKIIRTLNFYRGYVGAMAAEDDFAAAEKNYLTRIAACAVTHADDENRLLRACFGSPERQADAKQKQLKPEAKYNCSCLACRVFGNSMMRGRLTCSEASPVVTLQPKLFDHVAIDRFTGGAADAKKFDARPLMPVAGGDDSSKPAAAFAFEIQIERMEPWMLGLLGHLLKDLNSTDLRIGHATRRGYGRARGYVTQAALFVLPETEMFDACCKAGLNIEARFGAFGPHRKVDLTDWAKLFSVTPWAATGLDAALRATPGARLLEEADKAFQERVKESVTLKQKS